MAETQILGQLATEKVDGRSQSLDALSSLEFAKLMNAFDREAADAVEQALPVIAQVIEQASARMRKGGRLIYLGAGTSGRLGVLDASECPPTFGAPPELVQGIMAGGDWALRHAVEGAEDNADAGAEDLNNVGASPLDTVVAISASGYAPYCLGALRHARSVGALAVALSCNTHALTSAKADLAIEMPTGAEILSGSTRLKAGTATKMALNMISTGVMVRLGKTYGNLMVDMRATNAKLRDRAVRITGYATGLNAPEAQALLDAAGGEIKVAILMRKAGLTLAEAQKRLEAAEGFVSGALKDVES